MKIVNMLAISLSLAVLSLHAAAQTVGPNALPDGLSDGVDGTFPDPRLSMLEQLRSDPDLEVFTTLLPVAGIDTQLGAETGRGTVFAPTNSAFAQFAREITLFSSDVRDGDPAAIIKVLLSGLANIARVDNGELPNAIQLIKYHVLGDAYTISDLTSDPNRFQWPTLSGRNVSIDASSQMLMDMDSTANTSIQQRNIFCTNGWVNKISGVLVPYNLSNVVLKLPNVPSVSSSPTPSASVSSGSASAGAPDEEPVVPPVTGSATPVAVPVAPTDGATDGASPNSPTTGDSDSSGSPGDSGATSGESTPAAVDSGDSGTTDTGSNGVSDGDEDSEDADTTGGPDGDANDDDDDSASPSNSPDGEDDGVCFPASATMTTADSRVVRMDQLTSGMSVMHSQSGASKIFLFTHRAPLKRRQRFVRLTTACAHSVTLTASHYVREAGGSLVAAGAVAVADSLLTVDGPCDVIAKDVVVQDGLYAPHSMHGDLVVGGVVVSSYSKAVHPRVAHALLAPVRWMVRSAGVVEPLGSMFYNGADWALRMLPSGGDRH